MGEAGAVITDREDLATKLRFCVITDRFVSTPIPWWAGTAEWTASGGCPRRQATPAEKANDRRRSNAARYNERLSGAPEIITPIEATGRKHVYHVYAVRFRTGNSYKRPWIRPVIGWGIHYPIPVHLQEAYADLDCRLAPFPLPRSARTSFSRCQCIRS
jgi:dTDP-4-amino-4,6-dideoxygalactose transaminase